jgi:hypothetical protein
MTTLGDYQFDVGQGLVIGTGTLLPAGEVTWLGAPDLRTADVDNPTDDGGFPGVDLFGTRTVTIEAGIRTPDDPSAALDLLARLQQVTGGDAVRKTAGALAVLRVKWPGRDVKRLYGRWRRVEAVTMAQAVYGWIPLTLDFAAMDPRWTRAGTPTARSRVIAAAQDASSLAGALGLVRMSSIRPK